MNHVEHLKSISLDGGVLCLDFINTVSDYFAPYPINYIQTHEEWAAWLLRVDLIKEPIKFNGDSFDLTTILKLRNILHDIFVRNIRKETLSEKLLQSFNKYLRLANQHLIITFEEGRIVQCFNYDRGEANYYLMPIIKSAQDLLLSDSLKNVKECGNCGWIYLDKSKNQTRRWCSMKACGNKIKTQKYYRKSSSKETENT